MKGVADRLFGDDYHLSVLGAGRHQMRLVTLSAILGGNVRVGLEDNFYLPNGEMARSNGDLIAEARRMTEMVGRRPATVAEARELLGVPRRDQPTRREVLTHPIQAAEGK